MSSRPNLFRLVAWIACWGVLHGAAWGQYRSPSASLNSEAALGRLGLVRAWQSQIEFDPTRGKLAGVSQYISNHSAQTIYEVKYSGGRVTFSERDLDAFHQPLGAVGAKQKATEWVTNWQARTKSKSEPEISEAVVPDVVLAATSATGVVQCINAETGRTLWTNKVGGVRHPTTTAAVNERHVAVINGSTLYMLDRTDGRVLWERTTTHPAGAGPAMSEELVFVPMIDGHLDIFYENEPRRPAASFQSLGRCLVTPVVFGDAVAWPTDKANLYVGNSEVPGIRFRVTSKDTARYTTTSIRSAPTFRAGLGDEPPVVFFASSDGYLYSVDSVKGSILNRFSAGEPISKTPVVVGDQVYVITDGGTLFCVGADDADERWFLPGVSTFLAANLERLYCLDRSQRLIAIDARNGGRLGTVDIGNIDYSFLNTQSDRIYVGTANGALQCLHEARQYYPFVHGGMEPKESFPRVGQETDEQAEGMEPVDEDPFTGKPSTEPKDPPAEEEDPFGGKPAAKPAEDPADMPAEDIDPFGDK